MNLSKHRRHERLAFTMVELLVVVVIIGILVSLLTVGISLALNRAKAVRSVTEIQQLGVALEQFKNKFGFYPPSRIKLCELYTTYGTTALDTDSIAVLTTMFPRINISSWSLPTGGIDWNGNGSIDAGYVVLEGDQCLVFFLGGIPGLCSSSPVATPPANTPPSCLGFSTNPSNPAATTTDRIGPFFEFPSSRLVLLPPTTTAPILNPDRAATPFYYSLIDTYGLADGFGRYASGAPYAYFSAYAQKATNSYNPYYVAVTAPYSDCSGIAALHSDGSKASVWPYAEAAGPPLHYLKPSSYQIISAGKDMTFAAASDPTFAPFLTWTTATAPLVYPTGSAGSDDQASFTGSTLGVGKD